MTEFDFDDLDDNLEQVKSDFLAFALSSGRIKANDQPEEYYGTPEHHQDLYRRLGINLDDYPREDPKSYSRILNILLKAQTSGKDASGQSLFLGDFALLAALTGFD